MPPNEATGGGARFHLRLDSETVADVVSANPVCVDHQATLREVLRTLRSLSRGCALVCEQGKLIGIFTERDALRLFAQIGAGKLHLLDQPIGSLMVPNPVTISTSATVAEAIRIMSTRGFRRLPVVDEQGKPVGVLKVTAILHYFVEHFPKFVYTLPPNPHHVLQGREGA